MEKKEKPDFLSYSEVSDLLSLPKGTLYSLVSKGQIPHVRISKRLVRFSRETIETWISSCNVEVKNG